MFSDQSVVVASGSAVIATSSSECQSTDTASETGQPYADMDAYLADIDYTALKRVQPNFKTPQEQELADEGSFQCAYDYFQGHYARAERSIAPYASTQPFHALAIGALSFLCATITFDAKYVEFTSRRLNYCRALLAREQAVTRPTSAIGSITNTVSSAVNGVTRMMGGLLPGASGNRNINAADKKRKGKRRNQTTSPVVAQTADAPGTLKRHNSEIRGEFMDMQCLVLIAYAQLLQEGVMGFIKGGLNLRRCYNMVEALWRELNQAGGYQTPLVDRNTRMGIAFGYGIVNVLISVLPTKILRVISVFGYHGDRKLGFKLLDACSREKVFTAPLAMMCMLVYYASWALFAPEVWLPLHRAKAEQYIQQARETYPGSPLFRFFAARYARQYGRFDEAMAEFSELVKVPCGDDPRRRGAPLTRSAWDTQFQLVSYELGMTELFRLNFTAAAGHFKALADARYYPSITGRYLQAVCLEAAGDPVAADEAYAQVAAIDVRTCGGRVVSSDQFVLRRLKLRAKQYPSKRDAWRAALEVLVIWNGHTCMPREQLERCRDWASRALETASGDERGTTHWILGCMLKQLGDYDTADRHLSEAGSTRMRYDTFVAPYALYERGTLAWLRGDRLAAQEHWQKAPSANSDYHFEYRLAFRLHLCGIAIEEYQTIDKRADPQCL